MSEQTEHPVIEFVHEELETRFTVPERPTVRQQLLYKGEIGFAMNAEMYLKTWRGAKLLIQDWECPHLSLDDDINEIDSPSAAKVIQWAGMQVWRYILDLEDIPKN